MELTTEEWVALAADLGTASPVFLAGEPFVSWSPELRREVATIGRRALLARAAIALDDRGESVVPADLAALCRLLGNPDLYIRIAVGGGRRDELVHLVFSAERAVEVRVTQIGNYRVRPVERSSGAVRGLLSLDPERRSEVGDDAPADDVRIPATIMQEFWERCDRQPAADAALIVRELEVGPDLAAGLLEVVQDLTAIWTVEVLYVASGRSGLNGSVTSWLESGERLWMADREFDGEQAVVRYRRSTDAELWASIAAGFPEWWS